MANNPNLEALLQLNELDSKAAKLAAQKDLLPVALRRIETLLAQQRQTIEEKRGKVKELRAHTHTRELDLRAAEQEVEKLTLQLNTARTNKEYTAFQHEIAAKKADASRVEDELLAMMAEAEDLEADARELERAIAQLERQHADEARGVAKDIAKLDAQIEGLRQARQAAADSVERPLLEEYERIAAKKGASALAAVVAESCQGCFMQLPPELCHTLRGGRKIVKCPSCSRLLYMP
ncbi:MAG: hypothetical protein FJ291_07000 [Planctomycetes bacterium]|nr:hypothetical protein [Planctomycetota bacterium]